MSEYVICINNESNPARWNSELFWVSAGIAIQEISSNLAVCLWHC